MRANHSKLRVRSLKPRSYRYITSSRVTQIHISINNLDTCWNPIDKFFAVLWTIINYGEDHRDITTEDRLSSVDAPTHLPPMDQVDR